MRGEQIHIQQSGFTLAEIAVVVFLIGIMASVGLAALNAQMARASISTTQQKQAIIKDALIAYLRTNLRLPCPATDTTLSASPTPGIESRVTANTPANCTGFFGILPYATIGLPKTAALDGWDNFFSYAVSPQWTLTYTSAAPVAGGTSTNVANDALNLGDVGTMTVNDRSPATSATPTTITSAAVVFIVSHGKDGLGAFTTKATQNVLPNGTNQQDQLANAPVKTTWAVPAAFYQREYTDIDVPIYGAFDDVTQYLTASDLLTPLIKDGALKSAEAQWADQVIQINNALASSMFVPNTNCPPPNSQAAFNTLLTSNNIPTVDPWGGTLTYLPLITRMRSNGSVSPWGTINPYSITTSTAGKTVRIPTNVTLYATYQTLVQNYCN